MERLVHRTRWEEATRRADRYRMTCDELGLALMAARGALQQSRQQVAGLQEQLTQAKQEILSLQAQLAAATPPFVALASAAAPAQGRQPPYFVKANQVSVPARPPGQKPGHEAVHRPLPEHIDRQVKVPLPKDAQGQWTCPTCNTQLQGIHKHKRLVEDLLPAQRLVSAYHTISGYCPRCRRKVESRADDQPPVPPGVDLPQSQLGVNVLATCALLRMHYRLPYRQITGLLSDLPGLTMSPGAVTRQIQRMGGWLKGQYQALKSQLPRHAVVHIDETGWRIGGVNHWLWSLKGGQQTLYHIDPSRGTKVAQQLLGPRFKGTLVSDFYCAYTRLKCPKQKCLAHLLRELKETARDHAAFAQGSFCRRSLRLVQEMLLLKARQPACGKGSKDQPQRPAEQNSSHQRSPPLPKALYQKRLLKLEHRLRQLARGPLGGWQEPQARRLAKRLTRHGSELTYFLYHLNVPATNNAAERALRPAVVARKISGGNRSTQNARAEVILRSILTTLNQQHKPLLENLKKLLCAHWSGQNPAWLANLLRDA